MSDIGSFFLWYWVEADFSKKILRKVIFCWIYMFYFRKTESVHLAIVLFVYPLTILRTINNHLEPNIGFVCYLFCMI